MNHETFFAAVRTSLFGGMLMQAQVDALSGILHHWHLYGGTNRQQLAYCMATAYHEAGRALVPIVENLNYTSAARIRAVWPSRFPSNAAAQPYVRQPKALANKVYNGRLGNRAGTDDGWTYRGHGFVQITGRENFAKFGIEHAPEKALEPDTAARILVKGMREGTFTGKALGDYINANKTDYVNARRIVNADVAANGALIAGYAEKFDAALAAAGWAPSMPPTVEPAEPYVPPPPPDYAPPEPPEPLKPRDFGVGTAIILALSALAIAGAFFWLT